MKSAEINGSRPLSLKNNPHAEIN